MKKFIAFLMAWLLAAFFLSMLFGVISALGFAEEELGFKDRDGTYYPPVGDFPDSRISTVHDDLTLALAIAGGFSITDSHTIRIWDQLVDSEVLSSTPTAYVYGNAGFYSPPNATLACLGKNHAKSLWPNSAFDAATSSVTSRYGPYSPFFHFPHLGGADLRALHDWGTGITTTLKGYEAYAWGRLADLTLMQAIDNGGCTITRTVTISMPVQAGTLPAFATYLHSLADAYSHKDCLAALAKNVPPTPWGTHTVTPWDTSIYACDYDPSNPQNSDAHGREFGGVYTDTQRTIDAAHAIYTELSKRSIQREGQFYPLPLTTSLTVSGTLTTLDGAMTHFVTDRAYSNPTYRRQYIVSLIQALQVQARSLIQRQFLPVVVR